jgi:hypothetical protein
VAAAGSLLITLKAETESLRNDLNKAMGRIKQFEQETKRTSASVSEAFGRMGVGGETLKRSFGQVATGVLMMTGAFDKAGEAGKILEQSLGAFLVGGPIGAGVALVSGAFKMLAEDQNDAKIAAEKAAEAQKKWLDGLNKQAAAASETIKEMNDEIVASVLRMGGAEGNVALVRLQRKLEEAQSELSANEAEARKPKILNRVMGPNGQMTAGDFAMYEKEQEALRRSIELRETIAQLSVQIAKTQERNAQLAKEQTAHETRRATATEAAKDASEVVRSRAEAIAKFWAEAERAANGGAAAVREWAEEARALEEASARQAQAAEDIVRDYESQRQIAEATTEAERDRLEVIREIERLLSSGRIGVDQAEGVFDSMMGAKAADRDRKAREAMERSSERIGKASGTKAGEAFTESFGNTVEARIDPFFSGVFSTIQSGLTSAIVDGITNGGKNGADIFRNLVNQLLSQTISSILQSGIQALFGGILGGGAGGGGLLSTVVSAVGGIAGGGGGGGAGAILSLPDT